MDSASTALRKDTSPDSAPPKDETPDTIKGTTIATQDHLDKPTTPIPRTRRSLPKTPLSKSATSSPTTRTKKERRLRKSVPKRVFDPETCLDVSLSLFIDPFCLISPEEK